MHEIPGTLWIKVSTYLFEMCDRNYLIIHDYFSRNPVVKELPTTTADTVITVTKKSVSILDVPCKVVSDNGPQFLHRYDDFFHSGTSSTQRQVHDIPNQNTL